MKKIISSNISSDPDEKTIRRRIYSTIKVMMQLGLIEKLGKLYIPKKHCLPRDGFKFCDLPVF